MLIQIIMRQMNIYPIKEYMDGIALTVCALQAVSEISEINEKD